MLNAQSDTKIAPGRPGNLQPTPWWLQWPRYVCSHASSGFEFVLAVWQSHQCKQMLLSLQQLLICTFEVLHLVLCSFQSWGTACSLSSTCSAYYVQQAASSVPLSYSNEFCTPTPLYKPHNSCSWLTFAIQVHLPIECCLTLLVESIAIHAGGQVKQVQPWRNLRRPRVPCKPSPRMSHAWYVCTDADQHPTAAMLQEM